MDALNHEQLLPSMMCWPQGSTISCHQKMHQNPGTVFVPHRTIGAQLHDVFVNGDWAESAAHLPLLLDRLKLTSDLLTRRIGEIPGGEA